MWPWTMSLVRDLGFEHDFSPVSTNNVNVYFIIIFFTIKVRHNFLRMILYLHDC